MQIDDAAMSKPSGWASYMPPRAADRLGDYVQIIDDIVGQADAGVAARPVLARGQQLLERHHRRQPEPRELRRLPIDSPVALLRQQVCIDKFGA